MIKFFLIISFLFFFTSCSPKIEKVNTQIEGESLFSRAVKLRWLWALTKPGINKWSERSNVYSVFTLEACGDISKISPPSIINSPFSTGSLHWVSKTRNLIFKVTRKTKKRCRYGIVGRLHQVVLAKPLLLLWLGKHSEEPLPQIHKQDKSWNHKLKIIRPKLKWSQYKSDDANIDKLRGSPNDPSQAKRPKNDLMSKWIKSTGSFPPHQPPNLYIPNPHSQTQNSLGQGKQAPMGKGKVMGPKHWSQIADWSLDFLYQSLKIRII